MLALPAGAKARYRTPSGKVEVLNPRLPEPLPRVLPTHVERAAAAYPLRLQTAPSLHGLNSSFLHERDELRRRAGPMALRLAPADAAARGIVAGALVEAFNDLGAVRFVAEVTDDVPPGLAVAPGVRRMEDAPGARTVNALTAQRLTDAGAGSTFYDNAVDVRRVG
jgi:anaerobic selenocysteine-containing dehydrogenase